MNFIEAHKIVMNFSDAVANNNINSMTFLPYSKIKASAQEIQDALTIFFGHMALYETLSNEEYESCMVLVNFINNVVPDVLYDKVVSDNEIVSNASAEYKTIHKNEIEEIEERIKSYLELLLQKNDLNHERIKNHDFGEIVSNLQSMRIAHIQEPDKRAAEFIWEYVNEVYKYTTDTCCNKEDYFLFAPFDYLEKRLTDSNDPAEIQALMPYKEYIKFYSHVYSDSKKNNKQEGSSIQDAGPYTQADYAASDNVQVNTISENTESNKYILGCLVLAMIALMFLIVSVCLYSELKNAKAERDKYYEANRILNMNNGLLKAKIERLESQPDTTKVVAYIDHYHKQDCFLLEGTMGKSHVTDLETAKSQGYLPCSFCNP